MSQSTSMLKIDSGIITVELPGFPLSFLDSIFLRTIMILLEKLLIIMCGICENHSSSIPFARQKASISR